MDASDDLLQLLDLEDVSEGVFLGPPSSDGWTRVFGGQIIAQALAAACFTVEDWPVHSLHAYFLRPGKPGRPIQYEVSGMRDGSSFVTRNVVGVQRDELTFHLVASFQQPEQAPDFQHPMPEVPTPESFPSEDERIEAMLEQMKDAPEELRERVRQKRPVEFIRAAGGMGSDTAPTEPTRTWVRARGELLDDPNLHRCVLAYASDMGAIEPCMRAMGASFGDVDMQVASLDHALWFHRPFRADEWLLLSFEAVSVSEGRGLARGSVHDRQGRLVASIAQEGVMRRRNP
ncbi:MAG: thioesterase family protein [Myxococcales bacterium]|jgi:acyl-CoA thioesterase-2